MKKAYYCTIGLIMLFTGCNSFNDKIIAEYEKQISEQDSCIINLVDVVDFEWDKLYAIEYYAEKGNLFPATINKKLVVAKEFSNKLIFTLNDSIVYYEDFRINIENVVKNQVIFDIPDTSAYKIYPKEKAIFKVTQKKNPIVYYYLQQIE